ncbi:MAG TPA: hypothetical protein VG735_07220 [Caulobacterales bacterium]|nr:hypothetical protein [Caulobacterales bacterium]
MVQYAMDDASLSVRPDFGLKSFHRFGAEGPIYEVLGVGATPKTVRIRVVESGEELDYRLDRALADPEA